MYTLTEERQSPSDRQAKDVLTNQRLGYVSLDEATRIRSRLRINGRAYAPSDWFGLGGGRQIVLSQEGLG